MTGPTFTAQLIELELAGHGFAAQLIAMRIARHVAHRPPGRWDLGLLEESLGRARRICHEGVRRLVAQLVERIDRCHAARRAGSERDRIARLDALARDQLDLHAQLVAGSPTATRRPGLVERILDNLRRISDDAAPLLERDPLLSAPPALRRIDETIALLDSELRELRVARAGLGLAHILDVLAATADGVIADYARMFAGKERARVSLELLGRLCDRLGELQRHMIDIGIATGVQPTEDGRLRRATQAAMSLEKEYAAVVAVQRR